MELTQEQFDELQKNNEELKSKTDYLDKELKSVIGQRDGAKKKLKELEESSMAEQGKFKELFEQEKGKSDNYEKQLKELQDHSNGLKTKLEEIQTETRKELLERLPDGEAKKFAETLDLEKLRGFVKVNAEQEKISKDKSNKFSFRNNNGSYKNFAEWEKNYNQ